MLQGRLGTYDVVYTVTILFCHHGRCQCYKEDYWDVRRCIHSNYMYIVVIMEGVSITRTTSGTDNVVYTVTKKMATGEKV
jgi:hypothetical protein